MEKPKRVSRVKTDTVPTPPSPINVNKEQPEESWSPGEGAERYVVVRSGLRVSDKEYAQSDDDRAIAEVDFWQRIINRWPDGTWVKVVQFDKKKHRTW